MPCNTANANPANEAKCTPYSLTVAPHVYLFRTLIWYLCVLYLHPRWSGRDGVGQAMVRGDDVGERQGSKGLLAYLEKKSYVITKNSSMGNDFLFLKMNSSTGEMVLGGKQGLWIRERCIASLLFLVSRLLTCNTSSSKHCFLYDLSFCSLLSAQSKRPAQLCHSVRHLLL